MRRLASACAPSSERQIGAAVWSLHRLDRETSGVLLFARTADVHRDLCLAFEGRQVRKTYVAFTARGRRRARTHQHAAPSGPARKVRPARPGEDGRLGRLHALRVRKRWERVGAGRGDGEGAPRNGAPPPIPRAPEVARHAGAVRRLYGLGAAGDLAGGGADLEARVARSSSL